MAIAATTNGTAANSMGQNSDDQLMIAYARGDRNAFDLLYSRYKQPLYHYFCRNCGSTNQVDELFQDVWLRVITSAKRYRNKGRFRSWIFTLAHNCLIDYFRKSMRQPLTNQDDWESVTQNSVTANPADRNPNETSLAGMELKQSIQLAISSLPQEQREAFILREQSGFSVKEIGDIQNISVEAAKSRLRYAYQKLRVMIKDMV